MVWGKCSGGQGGNTGFGVERTAECFPKQLELTVVPCGELLVAYRESSSGHGVKTTSLTVFNLSNTVWNNLIDV